MAGTASRRITSTTPFNFAVASGRDCFFLSDVLDSGVLISAFSLFTCLDIHSSVFDFFNWPFACFLPSASDYRFTGSRGLYLRPINPRIQLDLIII